MGGDSLAEILRGLLVLMRWDSLSEMFLDFPVLMKCDSLSEMFLDFPVLMQIWRSLLVRDVGDCGAGNLSLGFQR